jgi:hypothetical protein
LSCEVSDRTVRKVLLSAARFDQDGNAA